MLGFCWVRWNREASLFGPFESQIDRYLIVGRVGSLSQRRQGAEGRQKLNVSRRGAVDAAGIGQFFFPPRSLRLGVRFLLLRFKCQPHASFRFAMAPWREILFRISGCAGGVIRWVSVAGQRAVCY